MNKSIERRINQIYNEVYKKVFNKKNLKALSNDSRIDIIYGLSKLESSNTYNEFAKKFAKELAKKGLANQRGVWRKYYEAARKSHYVALPLTYKEFEFKTLSIAIQHNFAMIKSIPQRMIEILNHKYTSTLIEEVAKGSIARGSFAKLLAKHGHKQAKLIARTEAAKLQTAITESRAMSIGSVAYTWISSKDRRTRPSHREMNGVIVFWRPTEQKPLLDNMRGNAGEFPNCRCDAQPIVDIDEITKSSYKVYDYNTNKIITMTKHKLIESLQKNELQK